MNALSLFLQEKRILSAACVAVLVIALLGPACAALARRVCFGNNCVSVEVADTDELRRTGLMFRTGLAQDRGMLFVFDRPDRHAFWMKNTFVPLDILWLDSRMRVVDVKTFVPPCAVAECPVYAPRADAKFVLEVNAGFVDAFRISIGDAARLCDE